MYVCADIHTSVYVRIDTHVCVCMCVYIHILVVE